jgi:hypothetical protein
MTQAAVTALQAALAAEHAAIYGYGVAGAHLGGNAQAGATRDWKAHLIARDALVTMITNLGATPVTSDVAYALPFRVHDPAAAAKLAALLEDRVARAYLGVVALDDAKLRMFGATAMQAPARRAAAWRGSTEAFPGMTNE